MVVCFVVGFGFQVYQLRTVFETTNAAAQQGKVLRKRLLVSASFCRRL
jgi:hypothetical protein